RDRGQRRRGLVDVSGAARTRATGNHARGTRAVQSAARRFRAAGPGAHRRQHPRRARLSPMSAFSLSANHVGLTVSNLERSIAFYRDLLGFHVAYERGEVTAEYMPRLVGIPGARLKIAGLDIPGLHLYLIEDIAPKGAATAGPPNDVGNVHIGFTVDDMWA